MAEVTAPDEARASGDGTSAAPGRPDPAAGERRSPRPRDVRQARMAQAFAQVVAVLMRDTRFRSLRLADTFTTGLAEFDRSWVLLDRALVERLMGGETALDLLELTVTDPNAAPRIAEAASRVLEPDFVVTDWRQLNRELFTALKLQQVVLFLVLGLIVLVSTFNVASTLVVLVRERMRDIGMLGALGLRPGKLRGVFLVYGGVLGVFGTLVGVLAGWGICWVLTTFELVRFDAEVAAIYFISSVPFQVEPRDVLAVVGFALLVTLLACFLPAWRAARVDPSSALRYE